MLSPKIQLKKIKINNIINKIMYCLCNEYDKKKNNNKNNNTSIFRMGCVKIIKITILAGIIVIPALKDECSQ
jgi:hypothetical protein